MARVEENLFSQMPSLAFARAMTSSIKHVIGNLRWGHWLGLAGLVLLFAALRWNNYNAPLMRDEGEIQYSAQLLIHGLAPYQHAFIQKPPGVVYTYAAANLLLPGFFWAPRLAAYIFVAFATLLLGFIAHLEFGKGVALPAMWLMTPMILLPGIDQYTCNPEMFMLLPLLGTVAVYCYSRQNGNKNTHWFAAGFLAATTLVYKYTAVPILALAFAAWIFDAYRSGARIAALVKALACLFAGGLLAAALGLGFYFEHGAFKQLWECTVAFNRNYVQWSGVFKLSFFWSRVASLWNDWWILFLVPWAVFLRPQPRAWFWFGLFICGVVSTSCSAYPQYYMLVMPFWALLTAAGIAALSTKIADWLAKPAPWLATLITMIVVLLVVRPDVPWMLCSNERFAKLAGTLYVETRIVADQASRMTSPNDYIFVAGSDPEIFCYAQRYSPTRFITTYPLMIPGPTALSYQMEAIHDLQQHPPRLIISVASGDSWLRHEASPPEYLEFLNAFLRQNYTMTGGYLRTNDLDGYWLDHINNEQFKNATLVMWERKQ